MKNNICLIGYSGHARAIYEVATKAGLDVDAYCEKVEVCLNQFQIEYLGFEEENETLSKLKNFTPFPAIGNNLIREKITINLSQKLNYSPINIIATDSHISESSCLEGDIFISHKAIVNTNSRIGRGSIINSGSIIEHDCTIGDFCHISPGSVIGGHCEIGKRVMVGSNATIIPGTQICDDVIIGAGSVVTNDITAPGTYVGVPAHLIYK